MLEAWVGDSGGGGFLKELVFELRGPKARTPHLEFIKRSTTLTSETVASHTDDARAWELNMLRGSAEEIAGFRAVISGPSYVTKVDLKELQGGDSWLVYYFEWLRPEPLAGVSIRHLLHDRLEGRATLYHRVEPGRSVFYVLGPDGDGLCKFYEETAKALSDFYDVRLLYSGAPRFSPTTGENLDSLDFTFAREAMRLGYFEEPRKISVRQLAALTGASKTATAHRLRRIERCAMRLLLEETMGLDGEVNPPRLRPPEGITRMTQRLEGPLTRRN